MFMEEMLYWKIACAVLALLLLGFVAYYKCGGKTMLGTPKPSKSKTKQIEDSVSSDDGTAADHEKDE